MSGNTPDFDAAFSEPLTVDGQLENALAACHSCCSRNDELDALFGQMLAIRDVLIGANYFAGGGTLDSNPVATGLVNDVE